MGLLDRLRGGHGESSRHVEVEATTQPVSLLDGHDDLEVVGESWYQDVLWRLSGGTVGDRIRHDIVAVLVPEPTNPHDTNAISVQIGGHIIGYLSRATAQEYLPGLQRLMSVRASHIGLRGVIVGGGYYDDGPGRLGVWLDHNPADFGIKQPPRRRRRGTQVPTVLCEPALPRPGLPMPRMTRMTCRGLTTSRRLTGPRLRNSARCSLDPDLIDRHFQFAELEARLYRSRVLYESAQAEYDDACERHDAEMDGICAAAMLGQVGQDPVAGYVPPDGNTPAEEARLAGL